jgi:hypothetical protein
LVRVSVTSAAHPWLEGVYDCAPPTAVIALSDAASADMVLRLGEPQVLTAPAFEVGVDDLLVVVHPQSGVGTLTLDQTRRLFAGEYTNWSDAGGSDLAVQVWTFSPAVDIQAYFNRNVMQGRPVSSLSRLAVSAQHMSDSVGSTLGSIGLLPRRWKAGNTREALAISSLPVLALVEGQPQGALGQILSCLQAGK